MSVRLYLCIAFLIILPAVAQVSGSGTIQGTVTDPSGGVVAGASIVATNVETGVETTR